MITIGSKRTLAYTAHCCIVSIGIDRIIAELYTSSCGLISIETIGASSSLHTLAKIVILEVIIRAVRNTAFGCRIDIIVRISCVRASSYTDSIVRVCIVQAVQHT